MHGGEGISQAVLAAAVSCFAIVAGSDAKMVVRAAIEGLRHEEWHVRRAAMRVIQVWARWHAAERLMSSLDWLHPTYLTHP